MARAWQWWKFKVDAHENPKVEALSDGAFRLWTRLLSLARKSPIPGQVFVVPGVGIPPATLIAGARCRAGDGAALLAELVAVHLIEIDAAGVIHIHDFDDHNDAPPSGTPEGERTRKAKYRAKQKAKATQESSVPSLSRQCPVTEVDVEEEVEEEKRVANPIVDNPRTTSGIGGEQLAGAVQEIEAQWAESFAESAKVGGKRTVYAGGTDDRAVFLALLMRLPDVAEVKQRVRNFFADPYCAARPSLALFRKQFDQHTWAPPTERRDPLTRALIPDT